MEMCHLARGDLLTNHHKPKIKLCLRGAQTCALPLFCDLDIDPMTLKLEGDQDILKYTLTLKTKLLA